MFLVGPEDGGRLVATIMGGYDGHRGHVNYLAVAPDCRRRGLGRRMMQEIHRRLLALGCPKINLNVRHENTQVMAFYQGLGYAFDQCTCLGKRLISDEGAAP